jgi:hypothetical protein
MKNSTALVMISLVTLAGSTVALAEDDASSRKGVAFQTTVDRLSSEPLGPDAVREVTEEALEQVAKMQERILHGKAHPESGPPFEHLDIDPSLIIPRNPPTDLVKSDGSGDIILYVNTIPTDVVPPTFRGVVDEPAVAASGDQVFYTGNWYAADSNNDGTDFSHFSPYPGPFPAPAGESFCCDQTMAHDPGSNTIFWLQQFVPGSSNTGTQRINVDQNSDGTWDCAYDITSILVGFAPNTWLDFPDLTVSDSFLYHASNAFYSNSSWAGAYAGRYPLSEMAACSTPLTIQGYRTTGLGSFRFARGAQDTMYFAAHGSSASMWVFTWADGDSSPTGAGKGITPWSNGNRVCPDPDGVNWCTFYDGRIQSGFLVGSTVGWMWSPSQGGSFPYPYVRISTFDTSNNLEPIEDIDIWSPDFAYMYPSAAVNSDGEIGGAVMWGGGDTHYASCSAWMAQSPDAAGFVPLESTLSIAGTKGPASSGGRSGDYTVSNVYYPDDTQFVGACFAYHSENSAEATYMRFGLELSEDIFADGFESGDTSIWSAVSP